MIKKPVEQRFWDKVNKTETCWLWTGSQRNKGYGAFVYIKDGDVVQGRAHRYSYELHIGEIPEGLCVLHHCDTPACVRPEHLFLGTKADNNLDMLLKGRRVAGGTYCGLGKYKMGDSHHNVKLNEGDIFRIREKYKSGLTSFSKIAAEYKITTSHAYRIVRRKVWKQVE